MAKITLSGYLLVHQLACINRLKVVFNIFCPQKLSVKTIITEDIPIFHESIYNCPDKKQPLAILVFNKSSALIMNN